MICKYIVIHHSATSPYATFDEIDKAHRKRGFDAIGYHYLVDAGGAILPGRPENIEGAHAMGLNSQSIGVCCIGNFQNSEVPEIQFSALCRLVLDLTMRYHLDLGAIVSHGELSSWIPEATKTLCPGTNLTALIPKLRERVESGLRQDSFAPLFFLEPSNSLAVRIDGHVKNAMSLRLPRWSEAPNTLTHVQITALLRNSNHVVWKAYSPLRKGDNGETTFLAYCPASILSPGEYTLKATPCSKDGVISSPTAPPVMACDVRFPLAVAQSKAARPFRAYIEAGSKHGRHPLILKVFGQVTNTGAMPWVNDDEQRPFRIGAMMLPAEVKGDPIFETRYDFSDPIVEPCESVPFQFTINLSEFTYGKYYLHIDVLRERGFWFTEIGSEGTTVLIDIPDHSRYDPPGLDRFLTPKTSFASGSSSASLLYVAPTLPMFDRSTGGRRLMDLFALLRDSGVAVTFLYNQIGTFTSPEKYLRALDNLGVAHSGDPLGYLSELDSPTFTLCVIGWYSLAHSLLPAVRELLPETRIAIDSIDLHWVREERALASGQSSKPEAGQKLEKQKELGVYSQCDEVWVVSEDDRTLLSLELPSLKSRVIGIPCYKHPAFVETPAEARALFVGGFGHPPNESAAIWAAEIVRAYNKSASIPIGLDIVGADPPEAVQSLHDGVTIRVFGYVPSLDDAYSHSRFFLAPMRFGAGVKGKICEAITRGLPVVTNFIGNEGLNLRHGIDAMLAESTVEFVKAISDLLSDDGIGYRLRDSALRTVLDSYGHHAIRTPLLASLVAPRVVIAIVTYNKADLIKRCLTALFSITDYPDYQVDVVSNGCTDGTKEVLEDFAVRHSARLNVHLLSHNEFFVRPSNMIIRLHPGADIVLMNNDVEVVNPGWLTNLVDTAYSGSKVAAAGGKILDPDGRISEAGAEMYSSGMGRNFARGLPADTPTAQGIRSVGFVSGCLMYMRRDAIETIGALDDDFHPMYFEDVAWNYAAHKRGWRTFYTPWAVAVHWEGSSAGTDTKSGMKRFQEVNRTKFLSKFSDIAIEDFNG